MKKFLSLFAGFLLLTALIAFPDVSSASAYKGLKTCAELIIPSLFPFFVATKLLSALGLTQMLGESAAVFCQRVFMVSGCGAAAFIIGISSGYPMGAAYISDLYENGDISESEAQKMLIFSNNTGPAFIISAVGSGVFKSSAVGLFLYAVHILSAVIGGIIFSGDDEIIESKPKCSQKTTFSSAITLSIKESVAACLNICGFIVAFSVLTGIMEKLGVFTQFSGFISAFIKTELHWSRALLCGFIELGNGIAAMNGLCATPVNLALAAFLLGWGGISVQLQTFSVLKGLKIKTARYLTGRLIIALIAGCSACLGAVMFF